ncbi:MAG: tetratricopeptide repeat protein [Promethearchaeota archaeon]
MSKKKASESEVIVDKKKGRKLFRAALKLYRIGDCEGAIEYIDEALIAHPDNYEYHNQKGVILDRIESHEEAIEAYNQAIKVDPSQTKAFYNKGLALKDLKKYEDALRTFDEVTKINIVHLSAHFEKAVIYELLGNYPEAIKRYEVILEVRPSADNVKRRLNKALEKYSEITNVWKDKIK